MTDAFVRVRSFHKETDDDVVPVILRLSLQPLV
jgi:hypothetical protein